MSAAQQARPVHLVVDTGVDDALAIALAWLHRGIGLTGVTAVAGNVSLAQAVHNTRFVLATIGAESVPLTRGSAQRSDGGQFESRSVHGRNGLAGLTERAPSVDDVAELATDIGADTALVCLAPMTTLLGLTSGEVVATYAKPGQANDEMDPQAARIVRSTWAVTDVTPGSVAPGWRPAEGSSRTVALVEALLSHQRTRGAGLGDAEALLAVAAQPADGLDQPRRAVLDLADLLG